MDALDSVVPPKPEPSEAALLILRVEAAWDIRAYNLSLKKGSAKWSDARINFLAGAVAAIGEDAPGAAGLTQRAFLASVGR